MRISDWNSDVCSSDLSLSGKALFFSEAWMLMRSAALQSVKLALWSTLLLTSVGLWMAYIKERLGNRLPNLLLLLTFIVPSTVLGIALIKYYTLPVVRSEERRVGKGWVRTCRTRGSPYR